jgi:hypothetical protein
MGEGFSGLIGAVVIACVIGWGLVTVHSDPPPAHGSTSCDFIAAIGCAALAGVGSALDDPDGYARAHPVTP